MSHTIEIVGASDFKGAPAEVEFYDHGELTPRRQRPVQELSLQMGNLLERLRNARRVTGAMESDADAAPSAEDEAVNVLSGPDVEIDERQAHLLAIFSDVVTFMWMKSWTLDLPFPTAADALLDLPIGVYEQLTQHAAKMQAAPAEESPFELNDATVDDVTSPTGASDD